MNAEESWNRIEGQVEETLATMEKKRRKAYSRGFLVGLLLAVAVCATLFYYFSLGAISLTIIAVVVIILVMCIALSTTFINLDRQYKKDIMPILVGEICPNAAYEAKSGVDESTFFSSMIFKKHSNQAFAHEDGISGKIENTRFVFCEAHLYYSETLTVNGKSKKQTIHQFDGMAFDAEYDRMMNGNIIMTTLKTIEGTDATFNKVKMDDAGYEKLFDTYTNNEEECRTVMTADMQQRFTKLYNTIKQSMGESDMTVSFYKNRMLILVPSLRNRFEARILIRLKSERVKEDFMVIKEMVNIVEAMA